MRNKEGIWAHSEMLSAMSVVILAVLVFGSAKACCRRPAPALEAESVSAQKAPIQPFGRSESEHWGERPVQFISFHDMQKQRLNDMGWADSIVLKSMTLDFADGSKHTVIFRVGNR